MKNLPMQARRPKQSQRYAPAVTTVVSGRLASTTARPSARDFDDRRTLNSTSATWEFDLYGGLVRHFSPAIRRFYPTVEMASTLPKGNREEIFTTLQSVVGMLRRLPPSDPMAIDEDTARRASEVLSLLSQREIGAPTIFSHGGDALVLQWDSGQMSRFLTVAGEELGLLEMNRSTLEKAEADVSIDTAEQRDEWMTRLGGSAISASVLANVR